MKIVVNRCYGGFGLSHEAMLRYLVLKGHTPYWEVDELTKKYFGGDPSLNKGVVHYGTQPDFMSEGNPGYLYDSDIVRNDLILVRVVEEMGDAANGQHAELAVVEIPDGVVWEIEEYDGREWIAEEHRTW